MIHKLKGHYLDTKHPVIMENLHGIKRVKGTIQRGKKPLLISHLKSIINIINEQPLALANSAFSFVLTVPIILHPTDFAH